MLTQTHKDKIAAALSKETPEMAARIVELQETHSRKQIAATLGIGNATLARIIKKHKIGLSSTAKSRAVASSTVKHIGKVPWNKGQELSPETKEKISQAVSGDKNGQYGRGMTEEEKERWRAAYFAHGIHKTKAWFKTEEGQKILQANARRQQEPAARLASSLRSSELMQQLFLPHRAPGGRP